MISINMHYVAMGSRYAHGVIEPVSLARGVQRGFNPAREHICDLELSQVAGGLRASACSATADHLLIDSNQKPLSNEEMEKTHSTIIPCTARTRKVVCAAVPRQS
jgi:hypothetical protein